MSKKIKIRARIIRRITYEIIEVNLRNTIESLGRIELRSLLLRLFIIKNLQFNLMEIFVSQKKSLSY